MRKTHHVTPASKSGWNVKAGGGKKSSRHFATKQEAVQNARKISQNQNSELIVHGKDGKIQYADSHGNDPNPPKDKR